MPFEPQVVIVGSGPAGVSAAFPLVERGIRVLMLDAGRAAPPGPAGLDERDTLRRLRGSHGHWKVMVGERFERFAADGDVSPKYRVPAHRGVFADFNRRYAVRTDDFMAVGALAPGGLSNAWSVVVGRFDDADLADGPVSFADLHASYRRVAQRIGVSGAADDDLSAFHGDEESLQPPIEPRGNAGLLYRRYRARPGPAHARGVLLGHVRAAVLTRDHGGRQACASCGLCLYGCAGRSMWSAQYDLATLRRFPTFRYRGGAFVTCLRRLETGWALVLDPADAASSRRVEAQRVILASGAIGSTRLVMDALGTYDEDRRLLTNPKAVFALFSLRRRIGGLVDEDVFGAAQLGFRVATPESHERYASGQLFLGDTNPVSDFLAHMPFSWPLSRRIARRLQPGLLLGQLALGGSYSRNTMRLRRSGDLHIRGGHAPTTGPAVRTTVRRLAGALLRYGVCLLPGSVRLCRAGEDAHYAGTVPMRTAPRVGEADARGEVQGLPGVHVVDGAALATLPAKAHTLTIMANADRIATALVTAMSGACPIRG